jgi:quinol monooxygenase YgiN
MIILTVRMTVGPRNRAAVLSVIRSMLGPTSVETGCAGCHASVDLDDDNVLTFSEEWDTQENLDRHVRSHGFRNLLSVLDLASDPPEFRIYTVAEARGMEAIRAVRRPQEGVGGRAGV